MISNLFRLNRSMNSMAFTWLIGTLLISSAMAARECRFFTDSFGRRRRTCYGLLPGIIAAIVVGVMVVLSFASLAWILRRRRQRALLQNQPIFSHEPINHLMSQQPPSYPPPNYPLATMQNVDPPRDHNDQEKNSADLGESHAPVPPRATLAPQDLNH